MQPWTLLLQAITAAEEAATASCMHNAFPDVGLREISCSSEAQPLAETEVGRDASRGCEWSMSLVNA